MTLFIGLKIHTQVNQGHLHKDIFFYELFFISEI